MESNPFQSPPYSSHNTSASSSNDLTHQQRKFDLIQEQQNTLKSLQEQRRQLEAQRSAYSGSTSGPSSLDTDFLAFSSPPATSPISPQVSSENMEKRLVSFMQSVDSKLELLSHSMKQLDLDIQLSVNKQDKHQEQLNTSLRDLESQVNRLASQQTQIQPPVAAPATSNPVRSAQPSPPSPSQSENATCPVCAQSFPTSQIHMHIESHFGDTNGVPQQSSAPQDNGNQEPGFWSKLFKKKDTPSPSTSPQAGGIQPPTYNYAQAPPPQGSAPPTAIPAFYSPSGTVQYISQPANNNSGYAYPR